MCCWQELGVKCSIESYLNLIFHTVYLYPNISKHRYVKFKKLTETMIVCTFQKAKVVILVCYVNKYV